MKRWQHLTCWPLAALGQPLAALSSSAVTRWQHLAALGWLLAALQPLRRPLVASSSWRMGTRGEGEPDKSNRGHTETPHKARMST